MIESEYIELMNREIDGVIGVEEKRRLHEYLSAHPEAKQSYLELVRLSEFLDNVHQAAPPATLKEDTLRLIDQHKANRSGTGHWNRKTWRSISFNRTLRFAAIFAVGIITGVIGVASILTSRDDSARRDASELSGTMMFNNQNGDFKTADQIVIETPEISGTLVSRYGYEEVRVEVSLSSSDSIDVRIDFDTSDLGFAGFGCQGALSGQFHADTGVLLLTNYGENRCQLIFADRSPTRSEVKLTVILPGDDVSYELCSGK